MRRSMEVLMDGVYVMVVVGFFGICLGYITLLSGGKS
jgi:hypothetical protein